MGESILNGKSILAVDDEFDVLAILEEETLEICPKYWLDKSTALAHMGLLSYLRMTAQGTAIGGWR